MFTGRNSYDDIFLETKEKGIFMKKEEEIKGQLSFDFCMDARNYVCQANALVEGKQELKSHTKCFPNHRKLIPFVCKTVQTYTICVQFF